LENLWDEEHGEDNHVELWLRFCEALGLDRDTVTTGTPSAATQSLVNTYKCLTSTKSLSEGTAALYAFESQIPEVAKVKINGLRDFYGLKDERSVSFFQVHQTLDEEHADAERKVVLKLASGKKEKEASINAVDIATMELWKFLDGVYV
jgi:pyrroloquinoline-quinone synthase